MKRIRRIIREVIRIMAKEKELPTFSNEYLPNSTILGQHTFLPIDFEHALNDNVVVMGSSGTGKTYSFVKPNILQMNTNYVVADAKGEILADTGKTLKENGYDIRVLNLVDLKHSMSYNPLKYMKDDQDVLSFADSVITSVDDNGNKLQSKEPFWDNAPRELLVALISFVREFLPKDEWNINTVIDLFNSLDQPVVDGEMTDEFSEHIGYHLFEWARKQNPNSYAVRKWDSVVGVAGSHVTWSSIVGILGSALAPYEMRDVVNLLYDDSLDFPRLLKPKTALFVMYDDADNSKNFISNVFYKQLFAFLFHKSREYANQSLPVKIRFFLDDFKNVTIPHFDDYLATARSRNISVCIMLQDESQLRAKYRDNAPSIIGNCATYLLTGTTDLAMAQEASNRFNMTPQEIRKLGRSKFLIDASGDIRQDDRYDFMQHSNFVSGKYKLSKEIVIKNHIKDDNVTYDKRKLFDLITMIKDNQKSDNNSSLEEAYKAQDAMFRHYDGKASIDYHANSLRNNVSDSKAELLIGKLLGKMFIKSHFHIWPQLHLNSLFETSDSIKQQRKNREMSIDYTIGLIEEGSLVPLLCLEIDGPSHFNDYRQIINDEYKNRTFISNGLPLIRIQADFDWINKTKSDLINIIKIILRSELNNQLSDDELERHLYDPNSDWSMDKIKRVESLTDSQLQILL